MNGCIVVAAHAESPCGEHLTVLDIGFSPFLIKDIQQYAVFCLAGNDDHILEVLGSGTDE